MASGCASDLPSYEATEAAKIEFIFKPKGTKFEVLGRVIDTRGDLVDSVQLAVGVGQGAVPFTNRSCEPRVKGNGATDTRDLCTGLKGEVTLFRTDAGLYAFGEIEYDRLLRRELVRTGNAEIFLPKVQHVQTGFSGSVSAAGGQIVAHEWGDCSKTSSLTCVRRQRD